MHTLLRLPTGIFYAQGVKANVLFFDRKPARKSRGRRSSGSTTCAPTCTSRSRKTRSSARTWTTSSPATTRRTGTSARRASASSAFTYEELIKRDKVNLDIFWLKDEALEDSANLPAPEVIAAEIVDDLQAALEQFAAIAEDLGK